MDSAQKQHAVCVPAAAQSHIKAMLKLAKLLHHKGFHITFVNTEYNHRRFLRTRGADALDGFSDFQFEAIPDGLPSSDADVSQEQNALCHSVLTFMLAPFRNLLQKLDDNKNLPPVSCVVSDIFMPFAADAAQEFGIPLVASASIPACSFMGCFQYRPLLDKGLVPLPDESCLTNGYLNTIIDWIPGMKDIRLKDLPTLFRTTDRNDVMLNYLLECMDKVSLASAILIQTFDALEVDVLDALSRMFPHVYSIGPIQLILNTILDEQSNLKSIGYNLWKEELECFQWLDSKKPKSVIYVNFGSVIVMTPQQLIELAWGLADSECNFLWIIRPDLVLGEEAILPSEFLDEIKERGLISGWCPQEQVLNHPSIGGFVTHCGWNSTVESLSAGVPMLCCPFFADQQTNCKFTCNEWEVGMEIDTNINRDEVKKLVKELIDGEKGKKLRRKALEWKKLAAIATSPMGSSSLNLDKFVEQIARI